MKTIYQELILDHYKNPRNFGRIATPSKQVVISNPLCGDIIEMNIRFEENTAADIKYRAKGCVISQASASMLTEFVKGKTKSDLQNIDKNFIINMLGIELGPNRIKCALLSLEALHKLI